MTLYHRSVLSDEIFYPPTFSWITSRVSNLALFQWTIKFFLRRDRAATLRLGGGGHHYWPQYWGGGGTRHFFLLNLYNFQNIGGHVPPCPLPPPYSTVPVRCVKKLWLSSCEAHAATWYSSLHTIVSGESWLWKYCVQCCRSGSGFYFAFYEGDPHDTTRIVQTTFI